MIYKNSLIFLSFLLLFSGCTSFRKTKKDQPDLKYSDLKIRLEDELRRIYRYRDKNGVINFEYKIILNKQNEIDVYMKGNNFSYTDKIWVRADKKLLKKLLLKVSLKIKENFNKKVNIFIIDKSEKTSLRYIEK